MTPEYEILEELTLDHLEHCVKVKVEWGWIPQGGIIKTDKGYAQAMIRTKT